MAIGTFNTSPSVILIHLATPRKKMVLLAKNVLFGYIHRTKRVLFYSMCFDSLMTTKKRATVK